MEAKRRKSQGKRERVGMAVQMTNDQITFLEEMARQNGLFCKHGGASGKPSVSSIVLHILETSVPSFPVYRPGGNANGTS